MKTFTTSRFAALLLSNFLCASILSTGCSLYHSSDRDYFDNNGSAGAPVRTALANPTHTECEKINGDVSPGSLEGLDLSAQDEALHIERMPATSSVTVRIARRTSRESATLCKLAFDEPVTDLDLASASQALVETSL
jgi:hypothetical protein